ncbi:hypothetical protein I4U23_007152 [Adineta vaga]|nr:hypothetical protein I4U23_007152 [Adineta vaga]
MRQLSLDRVYGCSTAHRHGIIALPDNRVAFLAGSYLIIRDCSTNEQRYLTFSCIESLYISSSGLLMGIIDRLNQDDNCRIHIYSTKPIELLISIEPDRFGSFIGMTIDTNESLLMILHSEPAYMITIPSVRVVHGPVINRMTKKEITPQVAHVSFCPHSSKVFCATGLALFKLYEIDQQIIHQQIIHFRAEFYAFTCHCWLDVNSILVATDHAHIFWIQEGSIRLTESFKVDTINNTKSLTIHNEHEMSIRKKSSLKDDTTLIEKQLYFDLFTSNEISPHVIISFREYLFVFTPIMIEPFFQINTCYRLQKTRENQKNIETHLIHKMSYIFDNQFSFIYLLTDRNQIFRYTINHTETKIEFEEKHIYGFNAYSILSIGLCAHKPWLITLGSDNWLRILNYKDNDREVVSKYISDDAYVITDSDPYGFHLCLAMTNRFQLYSITNYELRMVHQYETRSIRHIEMSMREGEIIMKQFRYVGIAVTKDCNRIYAITSDSSLKLFHNTNLEQEWTIENNLIPSAICLSKSERLLYIGMTNGTIRIYTIPLMIDAYMDLPAHCSTIRQLLVSHDDEYLVSIAESAYILLFKQTFDGLSSVYNQFSQISLGNFNKINESKRIQMMFEYILVTKSEFDEQTRKINEIEARINELETEKNLKLRSKHIVFSNNLNAYFIQFQTTMKQHLLEYEQLKSEIINEHDEFLQQTNTIQQEYDALQMHSEVIYENQMIEMLSRIQQAQKELNIIQTEYQNKYFNSDDHEYIDLKQIVNQVNSTLQSKWHTAAQNHEKIQEKERQMNEYIRQIEIDFDDEIETVKMNYEQEFKFFHDYKKRLTINLFRKRYNSLVDRMETRDPERNHIENEVKELYNRRSDLIEKLDHFRSIIKKKEDRIGVHDIKIHRLQQHILHVEKRKYVLDYKTKSLLERIEPIDQEITRLKTKNQNLEQQLTVLKRQQNALIAKQKDYELKLEQATKQLNLAKINHQHIWKIVQQRKGYVIKKAFEYTEINCTTEITNESHNSKEQLKAFIENICNTMQKEQQTENQLEIQEFMKEWHNQRKWLLNQLHSLTMHTEDNKQSFVHSQHEHRKAITPFINQLRQLHNLHDDLQKKIQKRFALLKIKSNDQSDFLQTISDILHVNENLHLTIDQLSQKELHIEIQDKEIDRLGAIIFRSQYSTPCLESNQQSEKILITSTLPSISIRSSNN